MERKEAIIQYNEKAFILDLELYVRNAYPSLPIPKSISLDALTEQGNLEHLILKDRKSIIYALLFMVDKAHGGLA